MKHFLTIVSLLICTFGVKAQDSAKVARPKIYHPEADAQKELKEAVAKAAKEKKHVFVQVGGNWCVWCMRFNDFVTNDTMLHRLMEENYVVLHLNYSKENKNLKTLAQLGYPQRFGFPVFVILDEKGNRLHTQNSAYLEQDKGYSAEKVADFLKQWSREALNPAHYKD